MTQTNQTKLNQTLLLFILFTTFSFGQKSNTKILAKEFIRISSLNQKIETVLSNEENRIFNNLKQTFAKEGLDYNIQNDVTYFKKNVHNHIDFIKKMVYDQLVFKYSNKRKKQLKKIIRAYKNKGDYYKAEVLTANNLVNERVSREMTEMTHYFIPKLLKNIKKKRNGIPVIVKYNNTVTPVKKLKLKLSAFLKDDQSVRIPLLNKTYSTIKMSDNIQYNKLGGIVVTYNNQDYIFKTVEKNQRIPKKLIEMNNPLSKYSFEDVDHWTILIDEKDKRTTITLVNVEKFILQKNGHKKNR